jgi:hypothetical protein
MTSPQDLCCVISLPEVIAVSGVMKCIAFRFMKSYANNFSVIDVENVFCSCEH